MKKSTIGNPVLVPIHFVNGNVIDLWGKKTETWYTSWYILENQMKIYLFEYDIKAIKVIHGKAYLLWQDTSDLMVSFQPPWFSLSFKNFIIAKAPCSLYWKTIGSWVWYQIDHVTSDQYKYFSFCREFLLFCILGSNYQIH